jgi:hypothetical protein
MTEKTDSFSLNENNSQQLNLTLNGIIIMATNTNLTTTSTNLTTTSLAELIELRAFASDINIFKQAHGDNTVVLSQALESNGLVFVFWFLVEVYVQLSNSQQNDLDRLGCTWAFDCLHHFEDQYPDDKRPRSAIKAKLNFLDGKITAAELAAAELEAWAAARSVSWIARMAAMAAAESSTQSIQAARDAANYAVDAAEESAEKAAMAAAESSTHARRATWDTADLAVDSAEQAAMAAAEFDVDTAAWAAGSTARSAQKEQLNNLLLSWER